MWWQEAISSLKGIGPKRAATFEKVNIVTLGDLLNYYPRLDSYIDNSQLKTIRELVPDGSRQLFKAEVFRALERYSGGGKRYGLVTVRDATGYAELYLFGGQRFLARSLKAETQVLISGRIKPGRTAKSVSEPLIQSVSADHLQQMNAILPVYNLTESLTQQVIRQAVQQVLELAAVKGCPETLPVSLVQKYHFPDRLATLRNIHFPVSQAALAQAQQRLVYEELFLLQCGLLLHKERNLDERGGVQHHPGGVLVAQVRRRLPFKLTAAQVKAWGEIEADMEAPRPMHRLLQGDVGSGKTVIAALALAKTCGEGFQGCIMAPTGILAQQHYETLSSFLQGTGTPLALLTSNTRPAERQELLEQLAAGKIGILVGTHALLQEDVHFKKLALVITDEQHRFGVNQRAALVNKSALAPDVLIMTATPIPRTLALTIYGDVEVSSMKGRPPGRKSVTTLCYTGEKRPAVYEGMVRQIKAGRQVYIVCASIEESENLETVRSVNDVYAELKQTYLKNIPAGLLHGKLKNAEKEAVMEAFARGELKALVTTTVIEVGVNVPNATLMIVENADRFGLAQLHQLRGRVGRGEQQSYCVLLTDCLTADNLARLKVLYDCNDGFELSERDLELRGSGQIFGLRQHGLPDLYIANILRDQKVLSACRKDAAQVLADPQARQEVRRIVANQFDDRFARIFDF